VDGSGYIDPGIYNNSRPGLAAGHHHLNGFVD
jgi:hypothetical protein